MVMVEKYMKIAYKESLKAFKKNEVPVGAVIVKNNKIISKAHNNRQNKYSVLGHAEINCITKAEKKLKDWRLDGCDLYVTLEPCEMCEKIISETRIDNVIYLVSKSKEKPRTNVRGGLIDEYYNLLTTFFRSLRK